MSHRLGPGFCAAALALAIGSAALRPAHAETVLVQAENGETGHAWLFGSRGSVSGECWLAVPLHVVRAIGGGDPRPFVFVDREGNQGQSGLPIAVSDVPEAVAATSGVDDLAFARVAAGPKPGTCLSRLGLPTLAYRAMLHSAPDLLITSLLSTSFGVFHADVARGAVDGRGGGRLELRPADPQLAAPYLKGGLSGATATVERDDGPVPFALIGRITKAGTMIALRFDALRDAFARVELAAGPSAVQESVSPDEIGYRILAFRSLDNTAAGGALNLTRESGCWTAAPPPGKDAASLVVEIDAQADGTKHISFELDPDCGPAPTRVRVEQRAREADGWSVASDCELGKGQPQADCRLEYRSPRQFRMSFVSEGRFGIRAIRFH